MLQPNCEILFFDPEIKELVWGNEDWTISAHAHGDVKVKGGSYSGMSLSRLWTKHPELFGEGVGQGDTSLAPPSFPLLVKIITTIDDLSIQVHPDDQYAARHENGSLGKTECWYILDCDADAHLVLGHNAKDQNELREMMESNRFTELIREVPIGKGDFIQMNPGTVHAIKGGIRLLEIQQSSDITYRLYDYGRVACGKPRPLHLQQALDVIKCPAPHASDSIIAACKRPVNQLCKLIACAYYTVWELAVAGKITINQEYPFLIICVIAGEGVIQDKQISEGDHFIVPCGFGEIHLRGEMRLILAAAGSH